MPELAAQLEPKRYLLFIDYRLAWDTSVGFSTEIRISTQGETYTDVGDRYLITEM